MKSQKNKNGIRILLFPWPTQCLNKQFVDTSDLVSLYDEYYSIDDQNHHAHVKNFRKSHFKYYGYFNFFPMNLGEDQKAKLFRYVDAAISEHGRIDAVVMPELSLTLRDYDEISLKLCDRGIDLFIAGVGSSFEDYKRIKEELVLAIQNKTKLTQLESLCNYAKISAIITPDQLLVDNHGQDINNILRRDYKEGVPVRHIRIQPKHHRWQISGNQIRQYNLGANFNPKLKWWEHISIPERKVEFLCFGPALTTSILICEDLAQSEPIGEIIRGVGPNLVIALLADGPQTASRWSARYATILSDDPGCSVLSLTSKGMSMLSRTNHAPSNSIGLWKDPITGLQEISPPTNCDAIVLSLAVENARQFSADGRHDDDQTQNLTLGGDPVHETAKLATNAEADCSPLQIAA